MRDWSGHAPAMEQLAEHVREDAAVFIVPDLLGSVDPDGHRESDAERRTGRSGGHGQLAAAGEPAGDRLGQALDRVHLLPGQARGLRRSRRA